MKTKHTPGPWFAVDYSGTICIQDGHMYDDRDLLCYDPVFSDNDPLSKEEVDANAKLIVAAPELLEACIAALEHHQGGHSEIGFKLREAIKKATE